MQTKGFIVTITTALILICAFYLSFNWVGSAMLDDAKSDAQKAACQIAKIKAPDENNAAYTEAYRKALAEEVTKKEKEKFVLFKLPFTNKNVTYFGYDYKEIREKQLGLGLDLEGGMNVTLQISVPDILRALANKASAGDKKFNQAINTVANDQSRQDDFVAEFCKEYKKIAPEGNLAQIFRNVGEVKPEMSDKQVEDVLKKEVNAMVDNSYNVLRTRIDRFGVVSPNIQKLQSTGRILLELPGIKEPERVRKLLQGAANLEFYETYDMKDLQSVFNELNTASADKAAASAEENAEAAKAETAAADTTKSVAAAKAEPAQGANADSRSFFQLVDTRYSGGCVVGNVLASDTAAVSAIINSPAAKRILPNNLKLRWTVKPETFKVQVGEPDPKTKKVKTEDVEAFQLVALKTGNDGAAALSGDVVTDARGESEKGRSVVSMSMNAQGARRWSAVTEQNIGKQVAIVLDDQVYSFPNVNQKIDGGNSQISGNFTPEEANDLANVLKSGKMVASVDIASESVIGPSLGQESINKGLISFVIALVLLMIFMVCVYGWQAGGIAVLGLILNLFFTFGILASFQSVLTLPGIAGIVLSLGMAVDANVLIFERIKEELRAGKSLKPAVADGYSNAFSAIFDSNLTSIITGAILAYLGTGPIKGFAVTLIIGICCSFFTAVFATRLVMEYCLKKGWFDKMTLTTPWTRHLMENVKFNFMGKAKASMMVVCCIVVAIVAMFVIRGLNAGIDFSGGRNYIVKFEKPVVPETLKAKLAPAFDGANVNVITIDNNKQVRISTNYKVDNKDKNVDVDKEIMTKLYNGLKADLGNMSYEDFSVSNENVGVVSSEVVGPAIASDMLRGAIWAVFFSLLAMALYILFRFRNLAFSLGALAAVAFTSFVVIGFYTLYGFLPFAMEIDQTFIAAILTVIGYQVNDTVVVFDRVREYRKLYPKNSLYDTFNSALSSTLARTLMTSITTLLVLVVIFFLGGASIRSFIFAMILGVIIGTCASLFIASPVAYALTGKKKGEVAEKK
ncbi:MAG: protein translocase subunit SecDF [Muribaculaceae bacterium]|nr:protein translocase subunit SecDF [Muribaculaceae bacterium]